MNIKELMEKNDFQLWEKAEDDTDIDIIREAKQHLTMKK